MKVHHCLQRSDAWHQLRIGRLCGSRAADMLATLKDPKKEAAGRRNLRIQLVLERVTGRSQEHDYQSAAMQQGIDREVDAAAVYEALTGQILTVVGFCEHDELKAGCSPDGFIGDDGMAEIKSPIPATHWDYLRTGVIPGEYEKQILHNLWITGRQWCDWLSFNPDFPEPLRVKLVRVNRDDAGIKAYEYQAKQFLKEVDAEVATLEAMAGAPVF